MAQLASRASVELHTQVGCVSIKLLQNVEKHWNSD